MELHAAMQFRRLRVCLLYTSGDYRRVALYGIDFLIERKQYDFERYARHGMKGEDFRLREELAGQIKALKEMKEMAAAYGFDISQPAKDAHEAAPVSYTHLAWSGYRGSG